MEQKKNNKFDKQDSLYNFPYHFLPQNNPNKIIKPFRIYYWLYDYIFLINFLIKKIKDINFENFLDFGCGDGRLIYDLQKNIKKNIYGYEISKRAASFFESFNQDIKLLKKKEELENYHNFFDLINFSEVIEHIPEDQVQSNIDLIYFMLKKNGKLIVTAPHENNPVHKKHYRHYNSDTLIKNFSSEKFELIEKKFLFKKSFLKTFVRKIIFNRLFIINSNLIFKIFYELNNFLFISEEKHCDTIFLIFKKK